LEGKKPKEVTVRAVCLNRRRGERNFRCGQNPGATGVAFVSRQNCKRVKAFERTYDASGGSKPRRVDPKGGFGMKQVR